MRTALLAAGVPAILLAGLMNGCATPQPDAGSGPAATVAEARPTHLATAEIRDEEMRARVRAR